MKKLLAVAVLAIAAAAVCIAPPEYVRPVVSEAQAATPNVPVGGGQVMVFPFHITGATTATTANQVKFNMPQPCQLIGAGAVARLASGTLVTDVLVNSASILSSTMTITAAGTWVEGTIGTPIIADEATVSTNITVTGAGATFSDVTLLLTCARR